MNVANFSTVRYFMRLVKIGFWRLHSTIESINPSDFIDINFWTKLNKKEFEI